MPFLFKKAQKSCSDFVAGHFSIIANFTNWDCLATYPLTPFPLAREGRVQVREGFTPLYKSLPLSFEGEGGKGVRLVNTLQIEAGYQVC